VGVAALWGGGFSRFGWWRQVGLAVVLILWFKALETTGLNIARSLPGLWPATYLSILTGAVFICLLLILAGHPYAFKRRPRAVP